MKLAKILSVIFISTFFSLSTLSSALSAKEFPKKNSKLNLQEVTHPAVSQHIEYHEIEGVLWMFLFDDDGKIIESHPVE